MPDKTNLRPLQPPSATQAPAEKEHTVLGVLEITPFTSKIFHNTRMLRVWLPANYGSPHNAHRTYPVLYMQDGQNLFDEATSDAGEWHLDETVDHLVGSFKIPPMIVVGIDYAGDQRSSEYLPYRDPHHAQYDVPRSQGAARQRLHNLSAHRSDAVHRKEVSRFARRRKHWHWRCHPMAVSSPSTPCCSIRAFSGTCSSRARCLESATDNC